MEESRIELYHAGKTMVLRCDSLEEVPEGSWNHSPMLVGDIRRGLLIDTENGRVESILYTHDGLLDKGYPYGCTGDRADAKSAKMTAASTCGKTSTREESACHEG